jgi:hypothetical protein
MTALREVTALIVQSRVILCMNVLFTPDRLQSPLDAPVVVSMLVSAEPNIALRCMRSKKTDGNSLRNLLSSQTQLATTRAAMLAMVMVTDPEEATRTTKAKTIRAIPNEVDSANADLGEGNEMGMEEGLVLEEALDLPPTVTRLTIPPPSLQPINNSMRLHPEPAT